MAVNKTVKVTIETPKGSMTKYNFSLQIQQQRATHFGRLALYSRSPVSGLENALSDIEKRKDAYF